MPHDLIINGAPGAALVNDMHFYLASHVAHACMRRRLPTLSTALSALLLDGATFGQ